MHDQKSHTDIGKVVQTHTHIHTYTHSRAGHSVSMYITVSIAHLYLWTVLEDIEKLSERPVRGIGIGTTESTVTVRITAKPLINRVTVTVRITKPLINGVDWKNTEIAGSLCHLPSRSAHDGRHISYASAPTETETTHTGHERDVDLSVFLTALTLGVTVGRLVRV